MKIDRVILALLLVVVGSSSVFAKNSLSWNTNQNLVSAEIQGARLPTVLKQISARTGWRIFVEPGPEHIVAAKFKDLRPGDALPLLLGKMNFALIPETNGSPRLLVFRTSAANATSLLSPPSAREKALMTTNIIGNELIVKLKPGANISDIAKLTGGKVTGKIEGLNAYRLEYPDDAAAEAAMEKLSSNDQVAAVDNNYAVQRPVDPASAQASGIPPPPKLQLRPPPDDGKIIIGLIDTAVQPLGNDLDQFIIRSQGATATSSSGADLSHGTSMAETILRSLEATTKGSTSVQILPIDVYGSNPTTSTFDVARGIVAAVNGGAKIINLSLGSDSGSALLHDVIQDVSRRNIPIFAAAGNEPVTTPFYPAAYPEVTAVTAVEQGRIAPYANRGSFIALAAPGTSVVYFNDQPYYVTGTSAASAFTSGVAAGYMDSTKSGVDQMRSFLSLHFGVAPSPGK